MKDQYFGDINDYRKYGLLRALANGGRLKIGICWMLTNVDATGQGGKLGYLQEPRKWREFDPALFDCLRECLRNRGVRAVIEAGKLDLIPSAIYYGKRLNAERAAYFSGMLQKFVKADLVFFDPDTGVQVPSMKPSKRHQYLLWEELSGAFREGHSVLVYQHFPHENRKSFIEEMQEQMGARTGAAEIHAFVTPNVVFFLAGQSSHRELLLRPIERIKREWSDRRFVEYYVNPLRA